MALSRAFTLGDFKNDLDAKREYPGFYFDGTRYGADGSVRGGDILKARGKECERVCRFDEILLIGGETSVKISGRSLMPRY